MATDLEAIGHDLAIAFTSRLESRTHRRRRTRMAALAVLAAGAFCAAAIASGIGAGLPLDPTHWSILGGGTVDDGRAEYVHAKNLADGSNSTFMVEHDAGLPAYQAFLLHERTLAAAQESSPVPVRVEQGERCTAAELTRAEVVALRTLRASFPAGTNADATKAAVDDALQGAFAGSPCRGLEYGGEQARLVYAGTEPEALLMAGAR